MIQARVAVSVRLLVLLVLTTVSCKSGTDSKSHLAPAKDSDTGTTRPDRVSNGQVSVDEQAVAGSVEGRTLRLTIPVVAQRAGAGSLQVTLIGVAGGESLAAADAAYDLASGARAELTAELQLPDDVAEQADRVRYSVQIRQADSELQVTRSLLFVLAPYELRLEGPNTLRANKRASYRIRALDPVSHRAVPDAPVTLRVTQAGSEVQKLDATTDETGSSVFDLELDEANDYAVSAAGTDQDVPVQVDAPLSVTPGGQKLLITTDKPLYQPGQTIHLRSLALAQPDNKPLADTAITFEVLDGKGNKVFKKQRRTDAYGIASVDFSLATLVNMGAFKVRAIAGEVSSEKSVEVSRYVLPKFSVDVVTDKPWYGPGATVSGSVDGRYFFGKAVSSADVSIEALTLDVGENVFARVMGKTDDAGHLTFSLTLPSALAGLPIQHGNALVTLRVQLTDSAGQVVTKDVALTVASDSLQISLVPESQALVPGMENRLHTFVTDPLGAPIAGAQVTLSGAAADPVETDANGYALLTLTPSAAGSQLAVTVTPKGGAAVSAGFDFAAQGGDEHVLVRTDKSVYHVGETVRVQLLASDGVSHAYVDWQNQGQSYDMRSVALEAGQGSFEVSLDEALLGENRIDAYIVDHAGNSVRSGRTIIVNHEGGLSVAMTQDKAEYKPGETAHLTLSVTDADGQPAAAALGVQIVDEAVFGLIDAQPGLLRTYFELENAFAKPSYELHAPPVSFERLVFERVNSSDADERAAAQIMAEAQLSALTEQHMLGIALGSWEKTLSAARMQLAPALDAEKQRLIALYKPKFEQEVAVLAAQGCSASSYYCSEGGLPYVSLLTSRVQNDVHPTDFWGNAYVASANASVAATLALVSSGPDEKAGTADDIRLEIDLAQLGVVLGGWFGDAVAATAGAAGSAATVPVTTPSSSEGAGAGVRVRKSFPETLYVNPALITDKNGKATFDVPMADSITSWRVSTLAHSQSGQLGGGQAGITVFQDFFVDVSFPAELTRGDEVEFPVVVYNYRKTDQAVRIELEQAPWFTALGPTSQVLQLAAGAVVSVNVPVRVERVGQQALTVRAIGESVSDAVQRSVRVVPDGTRVSVARSGSLGQTSMSLAASVPSDAIEGSPELYLDIYPGFLAQAVQGLDALLQVPSGCFEQTTSSTWPNVLVSRYLEQTHQTTPDIQLKADSYISAGYQRLLTFEHNGGGFSWFGEQDPQPDLSVTAFGLIEFTDMALVHDVDPAVIERTKRWLSQQQASDGSWAGGQTEFFSFQTSRTRNTAFVVWALAASGYQGQALSSGLSYVKNNLGAKPDAYTLALAANAYAVAAPDDPMLSTLFERLDGMKQERDGKTFWGDEQTQTSFYSRGPDAQVATTAMVVHALIAANRGLASFKGAIDFITASKDSSGNFGSTQSTVWALKALLAAASHGTDGAVGSLDVAVDGQPFKTLSLQKDQWDVATRLDLSSLATTGDHTVKLTLSGTGEVSYNLVSNHHVPWPSVEPSEGPLAIKVSYDRTELAVDDTVQAELSIRNLTTASQNMILASVGLPPGFDLVTDLLDGAVANQQISRYESTGKQLIVYVSALAAGAELKLPYQLRATMPVRAADGGARAYLYYQPEQQTEAASTLLVASGG